MCVCHSNHQVEGLPAEPRLLQAVTVRLIEPEERPRHDVLMEREHYLGKANAIGQVLRYVAE